MTDSEKISIIIPVCNAENTLERCLKSVCGQSYSNLEIIAVNDGSTDASLDILNRWKVDDSRIVIINQENKGAACARNAGLRVASGAYCGFVDADDFVEPLMFEKLYEALKKESADIASVAIREIYKGDITEERINEDCSVISGTEAIKMMLQYKGGVRTVVWDKLYCREIFGEGICFEEDYVYGEDVVFNFQAMLKCERYVRIPYIGYTYDHRESSVTNRAKYRTEQMSCLRGAHRMADIAADSGKDELKVYADRFVVMMCRSLFRSILLLGDYKRGNKGDYDELRAYAKNMNKNIVRSSVSKKEYLQWILFIYCPIGYLVLNKINHMKD